MNPKIHLRERVADYFGLNNFLGFNTLLKSTNGEKHTKHFAEQQYNFLF